MGAELGDPALVEDHDLVGRGDRRESMRDHQQRTSGDEAGQGPLDVRLRLGIRRRGGLVEDQDRGIGEEGAGDRDPLPLAAGELAVLTDHRVVASRELVDAARDLRGLGRAAYVLVRCLGMCEPDVVPDRGTQQPGVLEDEGDLLVELCARHLAQVHPGDRDPAGGGVGEAGQQLGQRRLARAGMTDERGHGARFEDQVDVVEHR